MPNSRPEVFRFVCKAILVHGRTGARRICGKVIQALNKEQFEFYVGEHKAMHSRRRADKARTQAIAPLVRT